jgi:tRNA pseudouridine55 synthase
MFESVDFEAGCILPVDKPYGWTSADVVRRLKVFLRWAGHRKIKIGHAGTLDPLATGVLLVCIGRATKQVDALQAGEKEYVARIELGATTPSFDLEHPVDERYPWEHITRAAAEAAVAGLVGEQEQVPPAYSAKLIDGKRAYQYARAGEPVEMKRARITVHDARLLDFTPPSLVVSIRCGKGTYIRSIARDLGAELGSGAHLTGLRRTRSGEFRAENCLSLEEIEENFYKMKQN